jgi:hypothetical protein
MVASVVALCAYIVVVLNLGQADAEGTVEIDLVTSLTNFTAVASVPTVLGASADKRVVPLAPSLVPSSSTLWRGGGRLTAKILYPSAHVMG